MAGQERRNTVRTGFCCLGMSCWFAMGRKSLHCRIFYGEGEKKIPIEAPHFKRNLLRRRERPAILPTSPAMMVWTVCSSPVTKAMIPR